MTEGDAGVSTEAPAPAAPVVAPTETAVPASVIETPAAAPPPTASATETTSPEVELVELAEPQTPQPSSSPPQTQSAAPPVPQTTTAVISSYLSAALAKVQFRKRAKLDKILALAAKKHSIKNDDVQKLLRVSDSTAQRYLKQVMQEGRLRTSKWGNDAFYETI